MQNHDIGTRLQKAFRSNFKISQEPLSIPKHVSERQGIRLATSPDRLPPTARVLNQGVRPRVAKSILIKKGSRAKIISKGHETGVVQPKVDRAKNRTPFLTSGKVAPTYLIIVLIRP